jgi:hypothetical protein
MEDLNLSESSELVQVYTDDTLKNKLKNEADRLNTDSSKLAKKLIVEALMIREDDLSSPPIDSDSDAAELQQQIQELERKLEAEQSDTDVGLKFDEEELADKVLTDQYQSLEEIKARVAETGLLDDALLTPLENQLWKLAAWDRTTFQRGAGWKLTDSEEGDGQ